MGRALADVLSAVSWRRLLALWVVVMGATATLVVSEASAAAIGLVFGALGALLVQVVAGPTMAQALMSRPLVARRPRRRSGRPGQGCLFDDEEVSGAPDEHRLGPDEGLSGSRRQRADQATVRREAQRLAVTARHLQIVIRDLEEIASHEPRGRRVGDSEDPEAAPRR